MKRRIHVLGIDPQNDFSDLPEDWLPNDPDLVAAGAVDVKIRPQLPVAGAHNDMLRAAEMIRRGSKGITDMSITVDMHRYVGIERPTWWMKADGGQVNPYTQILESQVRAGEYRTRNPKLMDRTLSYLNALEAAGKYKLMVWTVHCPIGGWGANVHQSILKACNEWEGREIAMVNYVTKGSNPFTEHYSPMKAEVVDPSDPSTQLNMSFINDLSAADLTIVFGEASSHCLKGGVEDLAANFGNGSLSKIALISDCMSPVTGFEKQASDFLADMKARGLQIITAAEATALLIENARR